MNYIYDIYLNLNKCLFDFYDWNKSDNLIHIKKIPIFILDSNTLKCIISNDININNNFIKQIRGKTEIWKSNTKLDYCALFTDYNDIIAIEFDKDGNSIKKSVLSIEEESEILEDMEKGEIYNITYKIIRKTPTLLKTRKQITLNKYINNELKNIDYKRLNYVCFECLGTLNNNNSIKKLKELENSNIDYQNLYNILKLTSKTSK